MNKPYIAKAGIIAFALTFIVHSNEKPSLSSPSETNSPPRAVVAAQTPLPVISKNKMDTPFKNSLSLGEKKTAQGHLPDEAACEKILSKTLHKNESGTDFADVLIPLFAIFFVFGGPLIVVLMILIYRYRKHKLLHQTVAAMVAKGIPIPPELFHSAQPARTTLMMRGIVWFAIGTGLLVFFAMKHNSSWALAIIPLMTGAGYSFVWYSQRKDKSE